MCEPIRKIVHYENLLEIKENTNRPLNLDEVNNWQLCRTCLTETSENDVDLGIMCVMDVQQGRFLNVQEAIMKIANLKVTEPVDNLPLKICPECLDKIKTLYYFIIQVHKADKILKLLAYKLQQSNDKINDSTSVKSESNNIPADDDICISKENLEFISVINNEAMKNVETNNINILTNDDEPINCDEYFKDSEQLEEISKNNQIIKEHQELTINDTELNEEFVKNIDIIQNYENNVQKIQSDEFTINNCNTEVNITDNEDIQILTNDDEPINCDEYFKKDSKQFEKISLKDQIIKEEQEEEFLKNIDIIQNFENNVSEIQTNEFIIKNCNTEVNTKGNENITETVQKRITDIKLPTDKFLEIFDSNCSVCQKIFNVKSDLFEHIEKFHPKAKALKCRDCNMHFLNIDNLSQHYRRTHKNQLRKKFICEFCYLSFYKNTDFKVHLRKCSLKRRPKMHSCSDCRKSFKYKRDLFRHKKIAHKKTSILISKKQKGKIKGGKTADQRKRNSRIKWTNMFDNKCAVCEEIFHAQHLFCKHVKEFHPKQKAFKCHDCDMHFSDINSLYRHNKGKHKNVNLKKFLCEFCGLPCSSKTDLVVHLRIHTGERPYSCSLCVMTFNNKNTLRSHQKIHSKDYQGTCKFCSKFFALPSDLELHQSEHSTERPFSCLVCGYTFKTKKDERLHHKSVHLAQKPDDHRLIPLQYYKCAVCNEIFKLQRDLIKHAKKYHPNGRAFKCRSCDKTFTHPSVLNDHFTKIHRNLPKNKVCKICSKTFLTRLKLNNHLKTHTEKQGGELSTLSTNLKIFHNKKYQRNGYKCELCYTNFENLLLFKRHLRKHTGETIHYTCSLWEYSFNCKKKLKKTKMVKDDLVQNSDLIIPCSETTIKETTKSLEISNEFDCLNMFSHNAENSINNNEEEQNIMLYNITDAAKETKSKSDALKAAAEIVVQKSSNSITKKYQQKPKTYGCDQCRKIVKTRNGLLIHQNKCHDKIIKSYESEMKQLTYNCDQCQKVYKTSKRLKIHRKKSHKKISTIEETISNNKYLDPMNIKNTTELTDTECEFVKECVQFDDSYILSDNLVVYNEAIINAPEGLDENLVSNDKIENSIKFEDTKFLEMNSNLNFVRIPKESKQISNFSDKNLIISSVSYSCKTTNECSEVFSQNDKSLFNKYDETNMILNNLRNYSDGVKSDGDSLNPTINIEIQINDNTISNNLTKHKNITGERLLNNESIYNFKINHSVELPDTESDNSYNLNSDANNVKNENDIELSDTKFVYDQAFVNVPKRWDPNSKLSYVENENVIELSDNENIYDEAIENATKRSDDNNSNSNDVKIESVIELSDTEMEFDQASSLNAANDVSQPANILEEPTEDRYEYIENKCVVCHKIFNRLSHFHIHVKKFHPCSKAFKCRYCDAIFSRSTYVARHFEVTHKDLEEEKVCEYCCASFKSDYKLKRHIILHTGERPYLCLFCEQSFAKKETYNEHRKSMHSEESSQILAKFVCECQRVFLSSKDLLRHTKEAHTKRNNMYVRVIKNVCKFCSKSFGRKSDLQSHLKVHAIEENKFVCSNCKISCTNEIDLNNHMKSNNCNQNSSAPKEEQHEVLKKRFLELIKSMNQDKRC